MGHLYITPKYLKVNLYIYIFFKYQINKRWVAAQGNDELFSILSVFEIFHNKKIIKEEK